MGKYQRKIKKIQLQRKLEEKKRQMQENMEVADDECSAQNNSDHEINKLDWIPPTKREKLESKKEAKELQHSANKFSALATLELEPPLEEANDDLENRNLEHSNEDVQSLEGSEDDQSQEESEGDKSTGYSSTSHSNNKFGSDFGSADQELKKAPKRTTNKKVMNVQQVSSDYYDIDVSKRMRDEKRKQ